MALILDTNALSAFADGDPALRRAIEREADLAVPALRIPGAVAPLMPTPSAPGGKDSAD